MPLPSKRDADLQLARAAAEVGGEGPDAGLGTIDVGMDGHGCRAGQAAYVDVRQAAGETERVEGGGNVAGTSGEGGSAVAVVV